MNFKYKKLEEEFSKLKLDYDGLQEDFEHQQQVLYFNF